jgi:hypothetical protein
VVTPMDAEASSPPDRSSRWAWGFLLFTVALFAIALRPEMEPGRPGVAPAVEGTAHAEAPPDGAATTAVPASEHIPAKDAPPPAASEIRPHAAPAVAAKPVVEAPAVAAKPVVETPPPTGGMEAQRARAADLFSARLGALSLEADLLDAKFQQYLAECQRYRTQTGAVPANPVKTPHGRDWFSVWTEDGRLEWPLNASCRHILREIGQEAASVRQALDELQEASRTAGVIPGVMRDLRRQYRLAFE